MGLASHLSASIALKTTGGASKAIARHDSVLLDSDAGPLWA